MTPLDLLLQARRHAVVPEIIEPELGIGAVGHVAMILLAPEVGLLIVKYAAHGQSEKLVNCAHPFAVAGGEIVVHSDNMDAAACERVKIDWQCRHQGLAFTGRHFGDFAVVQAGAADELHIEWDHLPFLRMIPDQDLRAAKAPAGVLHHGEGLGHDFLERGGQLLIILDLDEPRLPSRGLLAQGVVRKSFELFLQRIDFLYQRAELSNLTLVFRRYQLLEKTFDHAKCCQPLRQANPACQKGEKTYGKTAPASKILKIRLV